MNNDYELQAKFLQLKSFLSGISDISYAYQQLKQTAKAGNVPIDIQIRQLEQLSKQAEMLVTTKGENHESGK